MTAPTANRSVKKSCEGCPSLLSNNKQRTILGKPTGAPVCGLKLIAIGRPGIDGKHEKALAENKANHCDSHGKQIEFDPAAKLKAIGIDVAMPNYAAEQNDPNLVSNCVNCEHYMPAAQVQRQFGWTASMCTAKGQLIMDDRLSMYARDCDKRSSKYSPTSTDVSTKIIHLFPEYLDGWGKVDPLKRLKAFAEKNDDPFNYPSDKPVSDKAKEKGVRAWRRVQDPFGNGPDVFLPIFDHHQLAPGELIKVPKQGDDEKPDEFVDYLGLVYKVTVFWTRLNMTPALWGEPGTGKTEFFRHMAYLMALPFERLSITGSTELEYLEGKMMYSPEKGTYFQYGRIPMAWGKPNVLCIDEPNLGQPPVWQYIRPLTDNSKQLVVDANMQERINAHAGCYLGFAMNPAWDPRNVGTMELGAADGSRLMHVRVPLPPRNIETNIIMNNLTHDGWKDEAEAKEKVGLALDIIGQLRQQSAQGDIPVTVGIRDSIKFTRAMRYFDPITAAQVAFSDSMDPDTAQTVMNTVNQYVES